MISPVRVMLVDDQQIILDGLSALMSARPEVTVVGTAHDGESALRMFDETAPDVCLVDLRMRPMDGVEFTSRLRARVHDAKVILLTTYDTDEEIFRGFRAGIATYLLKDIDIARLVEVICAVHAGRRIIDPLIAVRLAEHATSDALTDRQAEVLQLVAAGKSNQEIAEQIFISEGTVKAHMRSILRKLGARDRAQAIGVALKRGLIRAD
jgi:two-component system, NarL family, response regulator